MKGSRPNATARRFAVALAVSAAFVLLPAPASAETVIAGPAPVSYSNPQVEIAAGESLDLLNLDLTAPHDVTAVDVGPNAQALFRSELIGFGNTVPVVGAEDLPAGTYDFVCSIHSFMDGTLTVAGGGAGGGGGDGGDTKAPRLAIRPLDERLAKVRKRGSLKVRTKLGEAATVALSASAGSNQRAVEIASRRLKLKKGTKTARLKLNPRGAKLVKNAKRLEVTFKASARDASGNVRKQRATATLR